MAAFNPQLPQSPAPNFTYSSRGVGTSNTFKTLFGGVASLGQDYLNARDNQNKTDIYNQTVAGRDQAAAPYIGALGESGYTTSPDGSGGPKGGPVAGQPAAAAQPVTGVGNNPGGQGPYGRWAPGGANAVLSDPSAAVPGSQGTPGQDQAGNPAVDPTTTGSVPGSSAATTNQPIPPAITQGSDQLDQLTRALDAGTISKSYYDLQILNLSKDLHTRFPGYGQQIDSTIQNVTGIDPTNALVSDAITISNANATKTNSAETAWRTYTTEAGNQDAIAALYPDVYTNPAKYADPAMRGKVQADVAQFHAQLGALDTQSKVNSLKLQQGQLDTHTMLQSGMSFASSIDAQAAKSGDTVGGINAKLDAWAKDPDHADPKEVSQAIVTIQAARRNQVAAANAYLDQPIHINPDGTRSGQTPREFLDDTQTQQILKAATANTDNMIEALTTGQYSTANYYANNMKIQSEGAANAQYNKDLYSRMQKNADTFDPSGKTRAALSDPNQYPQYAKGMQQVPGVTADIAAAAGSKGDPNDPTPPSLADTARELQQRSGLSDADIAGTLQTHVERSLHLLATTKDPKIIANEAHYFFSDVDKKGNPGFLQLVPKSQQALMFSKFTSKEVVTAIKNSGDDKLWGDYSRWVTDNATNTLQTNFADLQNGVKSVPGAKLAFDPKTFTITYDAHINNPTNSLDSALNIATAGDRAYQGIVNDKANGAVNDVNTVLAHVKQIADIEGADPLKVAGQLIQNLNTIGGTAPQGSVLGQIGESIMGAIQQELSVNPITAPTAAAVKLLQSWQSDNSWSQVGKGVGDQTSATPIDMKPTGSVPGQQAAAPAPPPTGVMQASYHPDNPTNVAVTHAATTLGVDLHNDKMPSGQTPAAVAATGEKDPMKIAASFIGKNERTDTQTISSFIKTAAGININPAQTAWCAAFVNAVLGASGRPQGRGDGAPGTVGNGMWAYDFRNYGTDDRAAPKQGDIVVFHFKDGGGHVGFVQSWNKDGSLDVLGGNQADSVKVSHFSQGDVIAVRAIAAPTGPGFSHDQMAMNLAGHAPSTHVEDRRGEPPVLHTNETGLQSGVPDRASPLDKPGQRPGANRPAETPQFQPKFLEGTDAANPASSRPGVTKVSDTVPSKEVLQAQLKTLQSQIDELSSRHLDVRTYTAKKAEILQQLDNVYGVKQSKSL